MDVCFLLPDDTTTKDICTENTDVREVGFHPPQIQLEILSLFADHLIFEPERLKVTDRPLMAHKPLQARYVLTHSNLMRHILVDVLAKTEIIIIISKQLLCCSFRVYFDPNQRGLRYTHRPVTLCRRLGEAGGWG
jgi:hypothetical protein